MRRAWLLLLVVGCGKPPLPPVFIDLSPPAEPDVVIKASDLSGEYAANEAASKSRYDGKWALIVGVPSRVAAGDNEFTLEFVKEFDRNPADRVAVCHFASDKQAFLADLIRPGPHGIRTVAVIGRVSSFSRSAHAFRDNYVVLDHCEIRKVPPNMKPDGED